MFLLLSGLMVVVFFSEGGAGKGVREVRHSMANREWAERCVTCHDPTSHPSVQGHNVLTEACTPCHNGMGRGITVETAHMTDDESIAKGKGKMFNSILPTKVAVADPPSGFSGETPEALFKRDEVMAGCLRCHPPQALPENSRAASGWKVFVDKACGTCHTIEGMSSGKKGPDLKQVGDILSIEKLAFRITAPQSSGFFNVMPIYRFSLHEAYSAALFLKGQSKLYLRPADYKVDFPEENDPVSRFRCNGCHKFRGKDGGVGPDLDLLSGRREAQWVRDFLSSPESLRPSARMPDVDDELSLKAIVNEALKSPSEMARPASPDGQYTWLCARCHEEAGNGKRGIALNLNTFPRQFQANQGYFLLMSRDRLLKSIANGIEGTSMPPSWSLLTSDEMNALLAFLLSRFVGLGPGDHVKDIDVPEKKPAISGMGKRAYSKHCARCHGDTGDRGARFINNRYPQPRSFMNRPYMNAVTDEQIFCVIARGVPGTRMNAYQAAVPGTGVKPKANLPHDTIWQLVDYVRRLSRGEG